jgi:hypothetical protein
MALSRISLICLCNLMKFHTYLKDTNSIFEAFNAFVSEVEKKRENLKLFIIEPILAMIIY